MFVETETGRLLDAIEPDGRAELRRMFSGPLAVSVVARMLGLEHADAGKVLDWYDRIVAAVTEITAGKPAPSSGREAFAALRASVEPALGREPSSSLVASAASDAGGLDRDEVVSNVGVLLFGGIETTDGMIANAVFHLLANPAALALVRADRALVPNAIEESLRLEPAASVVDRYATRDVSLAGAQIRRGELVRISLAGANRDPRFFPDPDRFDVHRENARHNVAFAHGPHVCIGMHLARLEAVTAIGRLLDRLRGLRLVRASDRAARIVFRK